jgi:hypothetical protein
MIKKIAVTWIKMLFGVIGLSYWVSFIAIEFEPKHTYSYALSTLVFSLIFAITLEAIRYSQKHKQKDSSI